MSYQGKEVDKWQRIQTEINSNRVIPISFKKTTEEKVQLANAKLSYKLLMKDSERFNNYREEIIIDLINSKPDFNIVLKPIR